MERNFPDGKQDMVREVWPGQNQRLQKEATMGQRILQAQSPQKTSCHTFCLFSDFKPFVCCDYVYHDRKEQKTGEAGFLADRHAAASSLIAPGGDAGLLKSLPSAAELVALFDDQKLKELAFCDKKKRLAEIQGYLLGVLYTQTESRLS